MQPKRLRRPSALKLGQRQALQTAMSCQQRQQEDALQRASTRRVVKHIKTSVVRLERNVSTAAIQVTELKAVITALAEQRKAQAHAQTKAML